MLIRLLILLSVLMAAATSLAQAYRWVDENGVVHFSDKPQEGAERIVLPSDNRPSDNRPTQQTVRRPTGPRTTASDQPEEDAAFSYASLDVVSPAAEETLWNIGGVLEVSLQLRPALQGGHQVRVYFDGNPRLVTRTSFQIEEVWRGVHNIQAEVVDADGQLMIRSEPNRFYVQATSIN